MQRYPAAFCLGAQPIERYSARLGFLLEAIASDGGNSHGSNDKPDRSVEKPDLYDGWTLDGSIRL